MRKSAKNVGQFALVFVLAILAGLLVGCGGGRAPRVGDKPTIILKTILVAILGGIATHLKLIKPLLNLKWVNCTIY